MCFIGIFTDSLKKLLTHSILFMNSTTISADIISYTSLGQRDKREVEKKIQDLLSELTKKYAAQNFFGRIIQGDSIECAMSSPTYSLRVALILKTFVKSIDLFEQNEMERRIRYFRQYGLRVAIAVAPLLTLDTKNGIIDGEAIYLSGRTISEMSTSNKKRIVVKETMFFRTINEEVQDRFDSIITLLDAIISKCSSKQCKVLFYKLSGLSEKEILQVVDVNQPTISQHSTAGSWNAIEKSINYFEKYIV